MTQGTMNMSRWRDEIARVQAKFGCRNCQHADEACLQNFEGCCARPGGPKYSEQAGRCIHQKPLEGKLPGK